MKTPKVVDTTTETLKANLGKLQGAYNGMAIAFVNAKGQERPLPYNRVDHKGAFVGDRETETEAWDTYLAIVFRAQHEQRKSVNQGASVVLKAGHSVKMGTASANLRTSKMDAKKAKVITQLAHAQKLAREIKAIENELAVRAEAERVKAEAETKAKADNELLEALMGKPSTVAAAA